jgi:hypothetical protein
LTSASLKTLPSDLVAWAVVADQRGEAGFDLGIAGLERVILGVADLRRVVLVIGEIVRRHFLCQAFELGRRFLLGEFVNGA